MRTRRFTGFGILVIDEGLQIEDSTFNWTGIVLITGEETEFKFEESSGTINGALVFDGEDDVEVEMEVANGGPGLTLTYSCEAIDFATQAVPMQTLGWIELLQ